MTFRRAVRDDLPDIVRMLADDVLGAQREECASPLPASYYAAFEAIDSDPNNELVVGEVSGKAVAVLQLTYIPNISRRGGWRALIESMRVDSSMRSSGLGRKLLAWAIERARESLGFVASHEGMKMNLR